MTAEIQGRTQHVHVSRLGRTREKTRVHEKNRSRSDQRKVCSHCYILALKLKIFWVHIFFSFLFRKNNLVLKLFLPANASSLRLRSLRIVRTIGIWAFYEFQQFFRVISLFFELIIVLDLHESLFQRRAKRQVGSSALF